LRDLDNKKILLYKLFVEYLVARLARVNAAKNFKQCNKNF